MPKFPRPPYYNTFNNPRWCARCGTQRGTSGGKFVEHTKRNGSRCQNSGLTPAEADKQAAKEYQDMIGAEAQP